MRPTSVLYRMRWSSSAHAAVIRAGWSGPCRGRGVSEGDVPTRYGKLDILYRPDGSDSYSKVKQRSLETKINGQRVHVAGKDDLVRMKLAAGRTDDLRDVANLTASERETPAGSSLDVLAPEVDHEWARGLTAREARLRPSIASGSPRTHLQIEARRSDLTDRQIEQWAHALAERLDAAGVIAHTDIDMQIPTPAWGRCRGTPVNESVALSEAALAKHKPKRGSTRPPPVGSQELVGSEREERT